MICASVLYPNEPGKRFDHVYYELRHRPLVVERLAAYGIVRFEIAQGLSGLAPGTEAKFICMGHLYFNAQEEFQQGMAAHAAEFLADLPNFTDISPQFQISQVV